MNDLKSICVFCGSSEGNDLDIAQKAQELGGGTKMPPFNAPETGRIGMLHDPQGIPFYVIQLKNKPDEPPQG